MSTAPSVATLQDAAVQYARTSTWVPQGATLTLRPGTTTLLLGPSGCGKSTLTRLLPGLVPHCLPSAYRGSARVGGQEVADAEVSHLASTVAVVMQDPDAQIVTTSVLDEVCYALENLCVPAADIEARARRALADVGLSGREATSPWELSGGQRQRLVLACALAQEPALLVLDEPTANLDPSATRAFYRLLPGVHARGAAVLVVEHDLDDVIEHVSHVIALGPDGSTLASGPVRRVMARHARALARAGVRLPSATALGLRLRDAGCTGPDDVDHDRPETAEKAPLTLADGARLLAAARLPQGSPPVAVTEDDRAPSGAPQAGPPAPTAPPALEVRDLDVPRGRRSRRRPVLTGVSLTLGPGQVLAVTGANGSGKTTLLRALAGLEPWTGGSVRVAGRERRPGRPGHAVTLVAQNPENQFLERTVADELAHGLRLAGADEQEVRRSVSERLERFGLVEQAGSSPFLLSGGQQRRLSVASVLGRHRDLICLDEPTFGQDRSSCEALMALLRSIADEGTAVVLTTHDMELVAGHADRVLVLADGAVLTQGGPAQVLTDTALLERAGLTPPPLARMRALAVATGAPVPPFTRWEDLP
ncbi:Putative HMP/thiamine import ATP-binding protein YkoD [Actinomyces bovis]|uniref:HMP/thiamine import ATP-binding protein YkoD n=1 Tax=Actinomyces bovis TaxID=1658 RepID=A0ABY1VNZ1_9ACTO|nr:ABC transporter ATP-binding protein [Actinomyces bovis]SPT53391.1 Putative HMP/thiamine import ATP-binding protein YkoD [Actinomyces bovis]VEG52799.1 Putative HMP/thiamine import ATP-binding protein YkoD [Actinomyces israelii]